MPQLFNASRSASAVSQVYLVDDHDEAYDLWRDAGVKQKILLHLDAHIDFEWIAEKDPLQVLNQKPLHQALEEFKSSYGWSFGNAVNNFTHLGNYLYRALQDGMVSRWYWIVPDSLWESAEGRRCIWRDLVDYYRFRTGEMTFPKKQDDSYTASFLGVPFVVTALKSLPKIQEPVLLNIDVDYLTTRFNSSRLAPESIFRQLPWIWPDELTAKLKTIVENSAFITLSNSVQGGFTPIQYKYFGEILRRIFSEEDFEQDYGRLKESFLLNAKKLIPQALEVLDSFCSEGVLEATRQWLKARLLHESSEIQAAREAFSAAIAADGEFASGYNNYGRQLEFQGRFQEAYEEYRITRSLCPESKDAAIGESDQWIREKKYDKAYKLLRELFAADPDYAAAVQRLGALHRMESDWLKASIYYELAIQLNPKDLISRLELGRSFLMQSRLQEAKICLREALAHGAHFPEVYSLLGQVYFKLGLKQKALELGIESLRLRYKIWRLRFKG